MHKLFYYPGNSWLHQLYPITKLAWLIIGSVLVFILTNGYLLIATAGLSFLVLLFIQPTLWRVRGFRFVCLTGLLLFGLYLLFDKSGTILLETELALFTITQGGLEAGLRFSGRFLTIVFLSYLFILTTEPSDLAYSLMKLGLPYRFGFMFVTALRLAPLMEDEGRTIYQAQLVRGIRYDHGALRRILLLTSQFMTPLLVRALQRADRLVFSMEGRGFGQYPHRTFCQRTSPSSLDIYFTAMMLVLSGLFLLINFGGFN